MDKIKKIIDIFNKLKKKRILIIGDIILDDYVYGNASKVSTGIKIPIIERNKSMYKLGGAANIAANIAKFSSEVTIIGAVGNDDSSKIVSSLLKEYDINFNKITSEKTILKQRIYIDNQQIVRLDNSCYIDPPLDKIKLLLEKYIFDMIVIADYSYGMINNSVIKLITEKAIEKEIEVFLTSRDFDSICAENVSCVVLNENEAVNILSNDNGGTFVSKSIKGVKDYIITLGNRGIFHQNNKARELINTTETYPVNVSGAGDTVLAVLSLLYSENITMKSMLELCNIAGRLAISDRLTYVISEEELLEEVLNMEIKKNCINKISSLNTAGEIVDIWKKRNKKIVFTNGCYDLFHLGHIKSFQIAKEYGDKLVVAVNSDESIKRLKGENRPINKLEERLTMLSSLEMIDLLIPFNSDTAIEVIKKIHPDIYVKGEEYKEKKLLEAEFVNRVEFIPMIKGISTTSIIDRIANLLEEKDE